mgnify:CR=1 FL=1
MTNPEICNTCPHINTCPKEEVDVKQCEYDLRMLPEFQKHCEEYYEDDHISNCEETDRVF